MKNAPGDEKLSQPSLMQELESRYMYDGAAIATIDQSVDLADGVSAQEHETMLEAIEKNDNVKATESLLKAIGSDIENLAIDYSQFKEVIIIDSRVQDPHILIGNVSRDTAIEVILPDEDGVDQVANIMQKYQSLDGLHIISHGNQGELQLGNMTLNSDNLLDYQEQLALWGQSLALTGDILFYGCNVAEGAKGQVFIQQLTELTKADIAASTDATGAQSVNADGVLEYQAGEVEISEIVLFTGYNNQLAAPVNTIGDYVEQLGADIDGSQAEEQSGASVSLSDDGTIMAIGAPKYDNSGVNAGRVSIYEWDSVNSLWAQRGSDIEGTLGNGNFGRSISLSADGNTIAIGAEDANFGTGLVRVYTWDGSSWGQMGSDFNGSASLDLLGSSVSLSQDGTTLAIGTAGADNSASEAGRVNIYDWNGSSWVQRGTAIDGGASGNNLGFSAVLSDDGNTIAIGSPFADGINGTDSGYVQIYDWNGSVWVQRGNNIEGSGSGGQAGKTISLSADGNTIAMNDVDSFIPVGKVYNWNGSTWVQQGSNITDQSASNGFAYAISLSSDGATIAVSDTEFTNFEDPNGFNMGKVYMYQWNGSEWEQASTITDSVTENDAKFGYSVSLSADGSKLAAGTPYPSGSATATGHAGVYQFSSGSSLTTDQGVSLAINNISVSDPDFDLEKVRLQVTGGTLTVTENEFVTVIEGSNNSNDLTIGGDPNMINDVLATLVYQNNEGFSGTDTLTITSTDFETATDIDTMTIEVVAANLPPEASNNTVTTNEDTAYTFTAADFNYTDSNNDEMASVEVTTLVSVGSLQLNGSGVTLNQVISKADIDAGLLVFTPAQDANGAGYDSFGFSVNDGTADSSSTYTMTVDVTAVNDAPTAANNTVTTSEDTAYTFSASDFNFADVDGDSLASVQITTLESVGSLQLNGSDVTLNQVISKTDIDAGLLVFTPAQDANGAGYDSFGFSVNDGTADSASSHTLSIDVTAVNDAPTAANNTVTTSEDTAYTFSANDFNFADVDGDTLANIQIKVVETVGDLKLNGSDVFYNQTISKADLDAGKLTFTSDPDANGSSYDSFAFNVSDGTTNSTSSYTLSIDVTAVNDAPVLTAGGTLNYVENTAASVIDSTITLSDIDDTNIESATVTISGNFASGEDVLGFSDTVNITGSYNASTGVLTLTGSDTLAAYQSALRSVTYENTSENPDTNARTISWVVNDGDDNATAVTSTVNVTAVNDAPVLTAGGTLNYVENAAASVIDSTITL
ncbi:DUF4347 domain-containing protein, partial [Facilibium subflavum]|uniref:DUF4347 domain-containing protein n=1 Tax=Facilibium subflavum TaxID=2219058 RepID=UPI000E655C2B